jgi:hypothetical protein
MAKKTTKRNTSMKTDEFLKLYVPAMKENQDPEDIAKTCGYDTVDQLKAKVANVRSKLSKQLDKYCTEQKLNVKEAKEFKKEQLNRIPTIKSKRSAIDIMGVLDDIGN